jgi:hypothetical protein
LKNHVRVERYRDGVECYLFSNMKGCKESHRYAVSPSKPESRRPQQNLTTPRWFRISEEDTPPPESTERLEEESGEANLIVVKPMSVNGLNISKQKAHCSLCGREWLDASVGSARAHIQEHHMLPVVFQVVSGGTRHESLARFTLVTAVAGQTMPKYTELGDKTVKIKAAKADQGEPHNTGADEAELSTRESEKASENVSTSQPQETDMQDRLARDRIAETDPREIPSGQPDIQNQPLIQPQETDSQDRLARDRLAETDSQEIPPRQPDIQNKPPTAS